MADVFKVEVVMDMGKSAMALARAKIKEELKIQHMVVNYGIRS